MTKRIIVAVFGLLMALTTLAAAAIAATPGVTADLAVRIDGAYVRAGDLGQPVTPLAERALVRLTPGTAAGQADLVFADTRSISASASEDLDLAGGLTDPFGVTLTFAKVKAIYIQAKATNTNDVVVGGAASNGFAGPFGGTTPTVSVKPGGVLLIAHPGAGWTVTASTSDLLKVANSSSGSAVAYDVIVVGTSS